MNYISHLLAFSAGAAIGSAITYFVVKKKYEEKAQNDIDEMKHHLAKREPVNEETEEEETEEEIEDKPPSRPAEIIDYSNLVNDMYTKKEIDEDVPGPYIITQDCYAEPFSGFDKVVLTYYENDGTLAEGDYIYDDLDYAIGINNLEYFGTDRLEDPAIMYIRNEAGGYDAEVRCVPQYYADDYPPTEDD